MLIEKWRTDYAKRYINEHNYPKIAEVLKHINMRLAYYNPKLSPLTDIDLTLATMKEIGDE